MSSPGRTSIGATVAATTPAPLRGREADLAAVLALLTTGTGVVLTGDAGTGKTRLAEETLRIAGEQGMATAFVHGRASTTDLPLGSFAAMLGDDASGASGVGLLVAARDALDRLADGRRLVLGVDDVHMLDPLSATLIQQLVIDGDVVVVLTVRDGEWVPEAVAELWRSGRVARHRVKLLAPPDSIAAAEHIVGEPLPVDVAERFAVLTEGNPLFVTALATAMRHHGFDADLAAVASAPNLVDFVAGKLHVLEPQQRDALAIVALAEPIGLALVEELADRESLVNLERDGWLTATEDGKRLQLRLSHPLYGEVLRQNLSRLLARGIYRDLSAAVQRRGARRRDDLLRVALWSVEGGRPLPGDQLMRAAHSAAAAGDFQLATRLARVVWDLEKVPAAGRMLLLTDDVSRSFDDPAVFASQLEAAADTSMEQALVAWSRAYDSMWRHGDPDRADATMRTAQDALSGDDELVAYLASRRALNLAFCGRFSDATEMVTTIGDASSWVTSSVKATGLLLATATGDPRAAIEDAETLLAERPDANRPGSLSPGLLRGAIARALVQAGDVHRAERVARAALESSTLSTLGGGMPAFYLAWVLLWRGRPAEGYQWASRASRLQRSRGLSTNERMSTAVMALCAAYAGQVEAADAALLRVDELSPNPIDLYDADVWHARSALCALKGDIEAARAVAREARDREHGRGALFDEAVALNALLRLGAPDDSLPRLVEIGREIGGLARLFADAATAMADGDINGVGQTAERFSDRGAATLAAAAASDAARLARKSGDERAAQTWGARAEFMAAALETRGTFLATVGPTPTTRREHEVAVLAAQGLDAAAIADRTLLSQKRVEELLVSIAAG